MKGTRTKGESFFQERDKNIKNPSTAQKEKHGKLVSIPASCVIAFSSLIAWIYATKNHHGPEPLQLWGSEMLMNKFSDFFVFCNFMLLQLYVICNLLKYLCSWIIARGRKKKINACITCVLVNQRDGNNRYSFHKDSGSLFSTLCKYSIYKQIKGHI